LTGAFELDFFRHRLVNRVSALRLIRFHSPSISSQSVALFQLHRYGLGETQPIQASLLAEMDELFQETPKPPPKVPVVSATPPAGTQPPNIPTLLQYWSRLPGWPEAVIGRRVQWKNVWGRITRTERGGKSLFFREEQSGQELELSADFIRMRCGSDQ
ncbi:MAG: hypothetical protein NTX09_19960, partial [Verrucomicrobia bacterium]|nr:hypothetical protein [Verrucomicrobiota bacterium]